MVVNLTIPFGYQFDNSIKWDNVFCHLCHLEPQILIGTK
jgi:hypothetical protein